MADFWSNSKKLKLFTGSARKAKYVKFFKNTIRMYTPRPAYMYGSINRSILFWAIVNVTLSVGYAAVISQWTLNFFLGNF